MAQRKCIGKEKLKNTQRVSACFVLFCFVGFLFCFVFFLCCFSFHIIKQFYFGYYFKHSYPQKTVHAQLQPFTIKLSASFFKPFIMPNTYKTKNASPTSWNAHMHKASNRPSHAVSSQVLEEDCLGLLSRPSDLPYPSLIHMCANTHEHNTQRYANSQWYIQTHTHTHKHTYNPLISMQVAQESAVFEDWLSSHRQLKHSIISPKNCFCILSCLT